VRHCLKVLKNNQAILIFPEGGRAFSPEDELALRNGAGLIAIKGGVPIIPVVFKRKPRPFVFNKFCVGEPISTEQYQDRKVEKHEISELMDRVSASMGEMLDRMGAKRASEEDEGRCYNVRGIVVHEGKVLVIKRVKEGREYFVFPGGHIDEGENLRHAAVREVEEETNIKTVVKRHLYKTEYDGCADVFQNFYLCEYKSGKVSTTDAEEYHEGAEHEIGWDGKERGTYQPMWVAIDELGEIDLKPTEIKKQLILDLKKYGNRMSRSMIFVKSD
jgi:8-oxo-dGTP pyrophosphatase MutT (NUDIX family)